jgi:hypothetical protein
VSARHTTMLDREGLLALFRSLRGRRLVGVADGSNCVELVFEHAEPDDGNLVTLYTSGTQRGQVPFGFVSQDLIDGGYGQ